MKYLIVEDFSGQEVPFVFPRRVDHADMREQLPYRRVTAAGFVELRGSSFYCYGGSAELGVFSRPRDSEVLQEALREREQQGDKQ